MIVQDAELIGKLTFFDNIYSSNLTLIVLLHYVDVSNLNGFLGFTVLMN